jgi:hypothetical protein
VPPKIPGGPRGLARVNDLVAVRQIQPEKPAHGIIVIHDQESFHVYASFLLPVCRHFSREHRILRESRAVYDGDHIGGVLGNQPGKGPTSFRCVYFPYLSLF